ncbi:MAG: UDP-glucose/GDP-mannose dehydrogenase family protein [Armatimonadetes bacterium]|nr:UDP-glucose/GDP-mannose dehydrogenase family protein [Armatimonadota bacterium]
MNVAVIGTGYVGLPTGVVLADLGHNVVCIDKDEEKIAMLQRAESPIYEPGVEELLRKVLDSGRLRLSCSIADGIKDADVVFIAVQTPSGPDGRPDLSAIRAVATEIGRNVSRPIVIVNKSTIPVGSAEVVERLILEAGADPSLVDVVSNPEFLREGSALKDSYSPDRIVIGAKRREAAEKVAEIFSALDAPVLITDVESAAMIKYASNSYLATKISYINAISRICELCGADVAEVAKGMGMDARIGPEFLKAGLGWGGSCFPKDVQGLLATSSDLGYEFGLLHASNQVNEEQARSFMGRLRKELGGFEGKTVALLGLSFKPNTDDIRDAKSLELISILKDEGAKVRAYDPAAMPAIQAVCPDVHCAEDAYQAAEGADAVVVVTEWGEFKVLDLERLGQGMKSRVLFDGRRVFRPEDAKAAGFVYARVGTRSESEGTE